jgi:hypothetical protein
MQQQVRDILDTYRAAVDGFAGVTGLADLILACVLAVAGLVLTYFAMQRVGRGIGVAVKVARWVWPKESEVVKWAKRLLAGEDVTIEAVGLHGVNVRSGPLLVGWKLKTGIAIHYWIEVIKIGGLDLAKCLTPREIEKVKAAASRARSRIEARQNEDTRQKAVIAMRSAAPVRLKDGETMTCVYDEGAGMWVAEPTA